MARPLRIEYPGAWYHVMNRGTGKRSIYITEKHFQYFLSLLELISNRFLAEIHAYCLMQNHYHLMIRTPEGNLQRIMRHLNGVYTQYFNRSTGRDGPLFRGRYKSILVGDPNYWLELSRYIHRNPLEEGLVTYPDEYCWSSYPAYIGMVDVPDWLHIEDVLGATGIGQQSRSCYRDFVINKTHEEITRFYAKEKLHPVLGDESFKLDVMSYFNENVDVPDVRRTRIRSSRENVLASVCKFYGIPLEDLFKSGRGRGVTNPARSVAMYILQQECDCKLSDIASLFSLASYKSASSIIRHVRVQLEKDNRLQNDMNLILRDLTPCISFGIMC